MVAAMEFKNNRLYRPGPCFKSLPDLESRLNLTARAGLGSTLPMPRLILLTDEKRLADPLPVVRALPSGSAVIVRHYDDPNRADVAASLINEARGRRIRVLIAGDARLALRIGAHGLHLSEALLRHGGGAWRKWRKPEWLVTAAAHSPKALLLAWRLGIDAALLSPVFPTLSHPEARPLGPLRFASWCRMAPLSVYALGGVTPFNARRLKGCGAEGIAGIGGFVDKG
jgi:thiamine-phosphate pyrophosphorylase